MAEGMDPTFEGSTQVRYGWGYGSHFGEGSYRYDEAGDMVSILEKDHTGKI